MKQEDGSREPSQYIWAETHRSKRIYHSGVVRATVGPLTWAGNEYVDAIRDNNVWKKVKRTLAQTVGGATLDTVKALAVKIATDMLMN